MPVFSDKMNSGPVLIYIPHVQKLYFIPTNANIVNFALNHQSDEAKRQRVIQSL